jgi:hypothetical protein
VSYSSLSFKTTFIIQQPHFADGLDCGYHAIDNVATNLFTRNVAATDFSVQDFSKSLMLNLGLSENPDLSLYPLGKALEMSEIYFPYQTANEQVDYLPIVLRLD